jgi:integrase
LPIFILLGIYTGQRSKAILGLQWTPNPAGGHIDLERGYINFLPEGAAQSKKRVALQPIPRRLRPLLSALRRQGGTHVIMYQGKPVKSVKKAMRATLDKIGFNDASAHTLRHTCITWLLQRGEDPWLVSGYVGMSIDILMKVYGHHCPDKLRDLADRI